MFRNSSKVGRTIEFMERGKQNLWLERFPSREPQGLQVMP